MTRILRLMLTAAGPYARQFRATLRTSLLATMLQAAAYACFVPLLAELCRDPVRTGRAWTWIGALAVLVAAEGALRVREMAFTYDYWHLVTGSTRLRLGAALRAMPQQELNGRAAGDLTQVVGGNATTAATAVSSLAALFVQLVTVPLVLGAVVIALDWRLGLVLVAGTLAAIPLVGHVQRRSGSGFREVDEADGEAAARIVEYVQGLPVLKATGQAGADSPRLLPVLDRQHETQAATNRSAALPVAGAQLLVQLALVGLVALGAALVLDARLTPATLLAVTVAAARFAEPLSLAAVMTKLFELSEAALARIDDVLAVRPLPVAEGGRPPTSFDISFEHVTFGYDGQHEPTLKDVDFTIPERSLTALVGPSGSGKTTVTRLISRYADPQHGTVRIGGVDLAGLSPDEVLRHIAVVFQDVYLFDDTIRANIALGRPDATDADIEDAARAAGIHDFVDALPERYTTRVGEIGSALSGGERQRISIARAFLKDAPVVLLDEPTAALDSMSETVVQQAVDRLVAGKTVVVIAHRLSTVVGADQILVVEDGRVTQRGTHTDLLTESDGRYARMWAAQSAAREWQIPGGAHVL
ncbi:ABC transporter ATP-binding protein [Streptomyces sp. WAC04114]|uniref:ABC transporter ATP-binding protein n=1 Tax=Streptomyces sp. WAC04114 TaxID=2867961 RepID=UPI001C8B11C3|nr:ABC transporter ATP-binding protein [Streptomyces sp. WAC04114]MBX9359656.1 ABC transporter ATP-binding protein/permease [Streptomyces sp. WAC04114]